MITKEQLAEIADKINQTGIDETIVSALRKEFSDIHFTYCSEDDIPNHEPVLEQPHFNLYLVDGRDHCLNFTMVFENATGIVIAEIYED